MQPRNRPSPLLLCPRHSLLHPFTPSSPSVQVRQGWQLPRSCHPFTPSLLRPLSRFDMRLLAVAQKLAPMIQESFHAIKEEITQMVRPAPLPTPPPCPKMVRPCPPYPAPRARPPRPRPPPPLSNSPPPPAPVASLNLTSPCPVDPSPPSVDSPLLFPFSSPPSRPSLRPGRVPQAAPGAGPLPPPPPPLSTPSGWRRRRSSRPRATKATKQV